jgi:hypothetical protein
MHLQYGMGINRRDSRYLLLLEIPHLKQLAAATSANHHLPSSTVLQNAETSLKVQLFALYYPAALLPGFYPALATSGLPSDN